eukprot:NODE_7851_length_1544_cov_12.352152.p1 GENE.NODE_7851_length_1544_cov_12.352152~~NODE_7851_length_1544_cov_12.352152.p1  ORF type:complete len:379 (-),score=88.71 NODE_7851_length_1544_cov_12.352152:317-1453(-)
MGAHGSRLHSLLRKSSTDTPLKVVTLDQDGTQEPPRKKIKYSCAASHEALFFPDGKLPCRDYLAGETCTRGDCKYAHTETGLVRLLRLFEGATKSLDVAVFSVTKDELTGALITARSRGVSVRIITDDEQMNHPGCDVADLRKAGIEVRTDSSKKLHMHHKFVLIDGEALVNGSFNWTSAAVNRNDENVVISRSTALAHRFAEEFERLWDEFGAGSGSSASKAGTASFDGDVAALFFPSSANNLELMQGELMSAQHSIDVAVFTLTHDGLCDALLRQHEAGVSVRVVTDHRQSLCAGADARRLRDAGINVRIAPNFHTMHHKFAVLDGKTVMNGSFNWTVQAANGNQENVIIYRRAPALAELFTGEFERMWVKIGAKG